MVDKLLGKLVGKEVEGAPGVQVEVVDEVVLVLLLYEGLWVRAPGLCYALTHRQVVLEHKLEELPRPIFEGLSAWVL